MDAHRLSARELAQRLEAKQNGSGWMAKCPAHDDSNPSLSISEGTDGKALVHCHAGCSQTAVIDALRARGLWPKREAEEPIGQGRYSVTGVTVRTLAEAKKLPPDFLRGLGVSDTKWHGIPAAEIPYADSTGTVVAVRFRLSLAKSGQRFAWRKGDHLTLYGLDRLPDVRRAGWVLLVEGESDCWTCWHHGIPALGIPGKSTWRDAWADYLAGLGVYLWQEPDADELPEKVAPTVPALKVIPAPDGTKDISEAHIRGDDVPALIARLRAGAIPVEAILRDKADAHLADLTRQAGPVLEAADPLSLVEAAIRQLGYGGDMRPPLISYLAATSRLLAMRPGAMPVHLLLLGPASSGKSWTAQTVRRLLPGEACHVIDAGSPRALIYNRADLRHRVVIFSEADSLPSGEDNPAASAIRNLLQDHHLHYEVTVRDPETGDYITRNIEKPGPTVLVTTAVRRLGEQLMTRLFVLEVASDTAQVSAALHTQATLELAGASEPDPALVAFQAYLQARAPWDVVVPFADKLADAISQSATATRILRDYARLLSLVKAVTVLRHQCRQTDAQGRLVAEIEDYAAVHRLVGQMYAESVSGVSAGVRDVVEIVTRLCTESKPLEKVTKAAVSREMQHNKVSVGRWVDAALRAGWLVNQETRKGAYDLAVGEPLPDQVGLPEPADLVGEGNTSNTVTGATDGISAPPLSDDAQTDPPDPAAPGPSPEADDDRICRAMHDLLDRNGGKWRGMDEELLEALNGNVPGLTIETLVPTLRRLKERLEAEGVRIGRDAYPDESGQIVRPLMAWRRR